MASTIASSTQAEHPSTSKLSTPFDIHETYKQHLRGPPSLPPGLAAVSSLASALEAHSTVTTISEAISLLSELNQTLKSQVQIPLLAAAGTDALLHYLVTTIAKPGAVASGPTSPVKPQPTTSSTEAVKTTRQVLDAAKRIIDQGLQARSKITKLGKRVIRNDSIVVLLSPDELLRDFVLDAADADVRFQVIIVKLPSASRLGADSLHDLQAKLRDRRTETITVPAADMDHAISQSLNGKSSVANVILLASASAALANGGILAPVQTFETFAFAKTLGIQTCVLCELWKSVRILPLPGEDVLDKAKSENHRASSQSRDADAYDEMDITYIHESDREIANVQQPPEYITSFVTEKGPLPPAALSEESIKFWF